MSKSVFSTPANTSLLSNLLSRSLWELIDGAEILELVRTSAPHLESDDVFVSNIADKLRDMVHRCIERERSQKLLHDVAETIHAQYISRRLAYNPALSSFHCVAEDEAALDDLRALGIETLHHGKMVPTDSILLGIKQAIPNNLQHQLAAVWSTVQSRAKRDPHLFEVTSVPSNAQERCNALALALVNSNSDSQHHPAALFLQYCIGAAVNRSDALSNKTLVLWSGPGAPAALAFMQRSIYMLTGNVHSNALSSVRCSPPTGTYNYYAADRVFVVRMAAPDKIDATLREIGQCCESFLLCCAAMFRATTLSTFQCNDVCPLLRYTQCEETSGCEDGDIPDRDAKTAASSVVCPAADDTLNNSGIFDSSSCDIIPAKQTQVAIFDAFVQSLGVTMSQDTPSPAIALIHLDELTTELHIFVAARGLPPQFFSAKEVRAHVERHFARLSIQAPGIPNYVNASLFYEVSTAAFTPTNATRFDVADAFWREHVSVGDTVAAASSTPDPDEEKTNELSAEFIECTSADGLGAFFSQLHAVFVDWRTRRSVIIATDDNISRDRFLECAFAIKCQCFYLLCFFKVRDILSCPTFPILRAQLPAGASASTVVRSECEEH